MKPVDQLGFGPKREVKQLDNDQWELSVTPPAFLKLPTQKLILNKNQYLGYLAWQNDGQLIQNALPDLTPSQREIILTGLGDDDFHRFAGDDE